jgi:hypothetical protein
MDRVLLTNPPARTRDPGLYLDVAADDAGRPVEAFLIDPPVRFPVEAQRKNGIVPLRHVGGRESRMVLSPRRDPPTVIEWISQGRFPNVADFLEEGRLFGFSRPVGLAPEEASQLTADSMIVFVHGRGFIENWGAYGPLDGPCPQSPVHMPAAVPDTFCCGYWWQDIEQGQDMETGDRLVRRAFGGWHYLARRAPETVVPRYQPGLVARMPIGGFTLVGDPAPWQPVLDALKATPFPVRALE